MSLSRAYELQAVGPVPIEPILPGSFEQLEGLCMRRMMLDQSYRYWPGLFMSRSVRDLTTPTINLISGEFGLQKVDPKLGVVVAKAGFSISGRSMLITHTPQGAAKEDIPRKARNRLIRSAFREELFAYFIAIANAMRLSEIWGCGAANHKNVNGEELSLDTVRQAHVVGQEITLERGRQIMDQQYLKMGFSRDGGGNFVLRLKQ